jgi:CheY-like chemotaxis protein
MQAPVPSKPSILVIDDEPDLRTLYELTLLREGYRVEAAGDLSQARQQLRKTASTPSSPTCGCLTAWAWSCCATWSPAAPGTLRGHHGARLRRKRRRGPQGRRL